VLHEGCIDGLDDVLEPHVIWATGCVSCTHHFRILRTLAPSNRGKRVELGHKLKVPLHLFQILLLLEVDLPRLGLELKRVVLGFLRVELIDLVLRRVFIADSLSA
jgi:hypothetical protein